MLPRLAGQHAAYTLRHLAAAAAGRRPGLQPAHGQALRGLVSADLEILADYLSRLPVKSAEAR
jgi:cytochrome c553